jgi:hypothetical protein
MEYAFKDADVFRTDSHRFAALETDTQNALLETVCGPAPTIYVNQEWPESKYATISKNYYIGSHDSHIEARHTVRQLIDQALSYGDWSRAARFMIFFKVKVYEFGNIEDIVSLMEFMDIFPMGCFKRSYSGGPLDKMKESMAWCYGVPSLDLLARGIALVQFRQDIFHQICSIFSGLSMRPSMVISILEIRRTRRTAFQIPEEETTEIINALNSQILEPLPERNDNILFYPCLLQYHYTTLNNPVDAIPRPIWSRKNHKMLGHPGFKKAARTIVLMQKFRYPQFTLHKDLIDMLLGHLFNAYIDGWQKELTAKKQVLEDLLVKLPDANSRSMFCWDQEVVYNNVSTESAHKSLIDALDAKNDISWRAVIRKEYRKKLCCVVNDWTSVKSAIARLPEHFKTRQMEDLMGEVIDYCRANATPLSQLYSKIHFLSSRLKDFETALLRKWGNSASNVY